MFNLNSVEFDLFVVKKYLYQKVNASFWKDYLEYFEIYIKKILSGSLKYFVFEEVLSNGIFRYAVLHNTCFSQYKLCFKLSFNIFKLLLKIAIFQTNIIQLISCTFA